MSAPGRKHKAGTGIDPSSIAGAVAGPMPAKLEAQLATLVGAAPAGDDWLHEIKFDGYRMLARIAGGKGQFISRNKRTGPRNSPIWRSCCPACR